MNLKVKESSLEQAHKTRQKFFARKSLSAINPEFFQGNFHKNVAWLSDREPDPNDYFVTIPEPILVSLLETHESDQNPPSLQVLIYILSLFYSFLEKNLASQSNTIFPLNLPRKDQSIHSQKFPMNF